MELLKREIIRYTDDYVKKNKIPGLIVKKKDGLKNFTIKDPVYIKLYKEASLLAKNLTKGRNLEKRELIFLIMSLVGALELTQDDFNKFNREINKNPGVEETEKWGGFGEFDVDDDDDDDDDDDEIV
jgi:phosphopantothenoylcysteine synthetase/decarboxylase